MINIKNLENILEGLNPFNSALKIITSDIDKQMNQLLIMYQNISNLLIEIFKRLRMSYPITHGQA